jgi:hypothetical protein
VAVVHIYTHNNTQNNTIKQYIGQHIFVTNNTWNNTIHEREECGPCPVFARYTLAFALQLRKKHRKTSVRVGKKCPVI